MEQKLIATLLICIWGANVNGQATLSASTETECPDGDDKIPTGDEVTVLLKCETTTVTIAQLAGSIATETEGDGKTQFEAATMVFKQDGEAKLTLTGEENGDGSAITINDAELFPTEDDVTSAVDESNTKMLVVTINNAPAAIATGGTWTCETTAGGDTDDDGGDADYDAEASANTLDLAEYCSEDDDNGAASQKVAGLLVACMVAMKTAFL